MNTSFPPPSITLERPLKLLLDLVIPKLFKISKRTKLMEGRRTDEVEKGVLLF